MKRKLIVVSPLIILVLAFLVMKVLTSFKEEQPKRSATVKPRLVETQIVELGDVPASLTTDLVAHCGRLTAAALVRDFNVPSPLRDAHKAFDSVISSHSMLMNVIMVINLIDLMVV